MNEHQVVALLVDDMFFAARINAAASEGGRRIERIRSRQQLEGLASSAPALIIVDLNSDRIPPLEAIALLKSNAELSRVPVVGFVSHVQTELIRQAKASGCDYVMPRSKFTQLLSRIITGDLNGLQQSG